MRLKITKTNSNQSLYVIKSTYINGKHSSKIVEKLGTYDELKIKLKGEDPIVWAKKYIKELNKNLETKDPDIIIKYSQSKQLSKDIKHSFNGGYLFLQKIYYDLGLNDICNNISDKYQFKYDLNLVLSNLIYSRILFPSSKLKTCELSKTFIEQPKFDYNHILRSLEVISKETDFIQAELYKNSCKYTNRNNKILYYDCTNYFFEIEEEDGLKQYGKSKENRPNPIVQMGLFMDGDGIPLAFDITPGNTNEQTTLKPLEEKIINDFNTSKFVVCTDAGLASNANRKFNNTNNRSFITTQSIKKLKSFLRDWALDLTTGWKLSDNDKNYDISKLRDNEELIEKFKDKIFYKERWIKENDLEQRLIITYSVKYQEYQKNIREKQVQRALKLISSSPRKLGKVNPNDPKRFIEVINTTNHGEEASETYYQLNQDIINEETKYDGLYAVCTNLEDSVEDIIKVNHQRWEIEENFRIMKSEFKARPVYLSRDDRIKAHFTTCFLALVVYRYLEKKLDYKYTTSEIIDTLKGYNFLESIGDGFIPTYTRTDITDLFHDKYCFRTDFEIISDKKIKNIFKITKS